VKVKTLMALFGFSAEHRVRQASLDGVVDRLEESGIACSFSSDARSANDYVTMSRAPVPRGRFPGGAPPGRSPGLSYETPPEPVASSGSP
jgi:hypothetical protein